MGSGEGEECMFKGLRKVSWGLILVMGTWSVDGAIVFHITGTPGSTLLTVEGSGSVVMSGPIVAETNSSFLQVPDGGGEWRSVRNNIGDFLGLGWIRSGSSEGSEWALQGDLRFEGEAILDANARFSYAITRLRMDDDVSPGGDDLDLRLETVESFPAASGGVVLTAAGQSMFSMGDGNTFDRLVPGVYEVLGLGDGGTDGVRYVIEPISIPEPSGSLLVGLGIWWCLGSRRHKRRHLLVGRNDDEAHK